MVSKKDQPQPEWLPAGWKLHVKLKNHRKYKWYVHPDTHQKFYSKPAVLRYLKHGTVDNNNNNNNNNSQDQQMEPVVANELPGGWTVQLRTRNKGRRKGTPYKCYIDPSSGSKFFSMPEVFRYLQSTQNNTGSSGQNERRFTRHSSSNRPLDQVKAQKFSVEGNMSHMSKTRASRRIFSAKNERPVDKVKPKETVVEPIVSQISKQPASRRLPSRKKEVVIENTVDKDLPSGWIKEMRKRVRGTQVVRTDPFYFHPASGLVLRSKVEVLRYLETGEISRHAYWRRTSRNDVNKEEFAIVKTSPTASVKTEMAMDNTPKKDLLAGEKTSKSTPLLIRESIAIKQDAVRRITRSSTRVRPTSLGEPGVMLQEVRDDDDKSRNSSLTAIELPSTSTVSISTARNTVAVPMNGCSNKKAESAKRKTKNPNTVSEPSRSSKRLAGIDAQPVSHSIPVKQALRATSKKCTRVESIPSLVCASNNLQDKRKPPDAETQNTLDFSTEEPGNNSDSLMQNVPPVFPENEVIDVPPITIVPSSEKDTVVLDPRDQPILVKQPDALLGSKEKSVPKCPVGPVTEEKPGSIASRDTDPSGSAFSFPPPLWSDPCLEFAYKTLTGAIPLDDNLAIEDYIQHQLRASKHHDEFQSLPDIDMPGFLQNDATKPAPLLSEGVRLQKGNGLAPRKTSR
ncbi:uncharacterized protein LOC141653793 isoform X1 [Silene latifolia]|uniref:uncharacterized protein LOC141653793 isoform X1 n=1 Tax=Silene latifolia TaxID=37657 RepID=UPI003D779C70